MVRNRPEWVGPGLGQERTKGSKRKKERSVEAWYRLSNWLLKICELSSPMSNQLFVTKMTTCGWAWKNDCLLRRCTELCTLYLKENSGANGNGSGTDRILGLARTLP